jgi:hypothetical protein
MLDILHTLNASCNQEAGFAQAHAKHQQTWMSLNFDQMFAWDAKMQVACWPCKAHIIAGAFAGR